MVIKDRDILHMDYVINVVSSNMNNLLENFNSLILSDEVKNDKYALMEAKEGLFSGIMKSIGEVFGRLFQWFGKLKGLLPAIFSKKTAFIAAGVAAVTTLFNKPEESLNEIRNKGAQAESNIDTFSKQLFSSDPRDVFKRFQNVKGTINSLTKKSGKDSVIAVPSTDVHENGNLIKLGNIKFDPEFSIKDNLITYLLTGDTGSCKTTKEDLEHPQPFDLFSIKGLPDLVNNYVRSKISENVSSLLSETEKSTVSQKKTIEDKFKEIESSTESEKLAEMKKSTMIYLKLETNLISSLASVVNKISGAFSSVVEKSNKLLGIVEAKKKIENELSKVDESSIEDLELIKKYTKMLEGKNFHGINLF